MRRQSTRRTRIAWRRRSSAALAVVGALLVGNSLHAGRAIKDSAASAAALGVADDAGMAGMAHTAGMAGMAHAAALTAVPHTIRLGTNSGDVPVGLLDTAVVVWSATPAPDNFFGSLTRGPDGGSGSVLMRTQSGSVGDAVRAAIASHLPQGERLAEITDVRLGATVFVVQGRGDTTETEVREITSDWDVATATYAQRRDGVAWSTPGGDFGNVVGSLTLPNQPGVYQTSSNLVGLMDHGANGFALRVTSPIVPDNNTLLNLSEAPDGRRPYLDVTYTTTTDVPAPPGVAYNPALIPTGSPGSGEVLIRNSGFFPAPSDGTGNFRTECAYSHMLPDDPILYPGQPGRAHLHTFWGNTGANASSTYESLRSSGNSTCRGGIANRSGYWAPSIIDTATGRPIAPVVAKTYYKTGYIIAPNEIHALPDGLRMIAGDMHATGPQSSSVATWTCWGSTPDGNPSSIGSEIQPCVAGSKFLRMSVYFPQCWDGRLDSPDHMSHMAYPDPVAKQCPASHPTALPWVSYHLDYDIAGGVDTSHWRLSSDTYEPALPAGYSAHGDWFGGWDPAVKQTWTELCDRAAKDCQSHMLGDGREQYGEL